jgi:uncharacterized protein YbjT (DUF2867 family)
MLEVAPVVDAGRTQPGERATADSRGMVAAHAGAPIVRMVPAGPAGPLALAASPSGVLVRVTCRWSAAELLGGAGAWQLAGHGSAAALPGAPRLDILANRRSMAKKANWWSVLIALLVVLAVALVASWSATHRHAAAGVTAGALSLSCIAQRGRGRLRPGAGGYRRPDAGSIEAPRGGGPWPPILVTGATGYVGGRLVPRFSTWAPRALPVRDPSASGALGSAVMWSGDAAAGACVGLDGATSRHLAQHGARDDFHERDLAARGFPSRGCRGGVARIVYLGGRRPWSGPVAPSAPRQATGAALREGGVPVTEFRAAGRRPRSISFETIRHLTERLPLRSVRMGLHVQPIAVDDRSRPYRGARARQRRQLTEIGGPTQTYGA